MDFHITAGGQRLWLWEGVVHYLGANILFLRHEKMLVIDTYIFSFNHSLQTKLEVKEACSVDALSGPDAINWFTVPPLPPSPITITNTTTMLTHFGRPPFFLFCG